MSRWEVPDGWEWTKVCDIADVVGGGTPPSKDPRNFSTDGVPWLTPADLTGYRDAYIGHGARDLSELGLLKSSARVLPKGTVLFTSRAPIGYCTIASQPLATNQGFKSLVLPDGILPEFLRHYLLASKDYAESLASGTTFRELSAARMKGLEIPLAPTAEQRRIVAKIEALQERSRQVREALAEVGPLLEQFRQSVLAAAFRGDLTAVWRAAHPNVEPANELLHRIRTERRHRWEQAELAKYETHGQKPPKNWRDRYKESESVDDSDLPKLPEGWCWARWDEIGFCQNGRAFPSENYAPTGVKLLRPGNLHVSGAIVWTPDNTRYMPIEWEDEHPAYVVRADELIMNLTAQSLKDEFLGRVCLTGNDEHCLLNPTLSKCT